MDRNGRENYSEIDQVALVTKLMQSGKSCKTASYQTGCNVIAEVHRGFSGLCMKCCPGPGQAEMGTLILYHFCSTTPWSRYGCVASVPVLCSALSSQFHVAVSIEEVKKAYLPAEDGQTAIKDNEYHRRLAEHPSLRRDQLSRWSADLQPTTAPPEFRQVQLVGLSSTHCSCQCAI